MASKASNAFWPKNAASMSAGTWTNNDTYNDDVFHSRWGDVEIVSSPVRRSGLVSFSATVTISGGSYTPSNRHSEGTDWNGIDASFDGDHAWQAEGSEGWYGGSVYWPTSSPSPTAWVIPMQMHGNLDGSSPVIALTVENGQWRLYRRGNGIGTTATNIQSLVKGVWFDYLYFARWSRTSGNARTEFYWRQAGGSWTLVRSDTQANMYAASGGRSASPNLQCGCYASSSNANGAYEVIHGPCAQRFTSRQLLEDTLWGSGGTTDPPPPPPPPSTDPPPPNSYGLTTIGGALGPMSPNAKRGSLITIPQDGTIAAGKVALSTAGVNEPQSIRLVLYADSSGSPGALITNGASDTLELPTDSPMAWRDVTWGTPPSVTTGTSYWLVLHTDSVIGGNYARASATGALRWQPSGSDTFSDGSSDPFGAANTDDFRMSAYVVLTPGAVDPGGTSIPGTFVTSGEAVVSFQGSVSSANSEVPASRVAYFFEPVQVTRSVARPYEVIDGQKGPEVRWNNANSRWERI